MLIIDRQAVEIEFLQPNNSNIGILKLCYQERQYDFIRAFSADKLTEATHFYLHVKSERGDNLLLIREVDYYSLWQLDSPRSLPLASSVVYTDLQQAGIWFFQELWLRLTELLGRNQLESLGQNLFMAAPSLQCWEDLERLLNLDPIALSEPRAQQSRDLSHGGLWTEAEIEQLVCRLSRLAQKQLGESFVREIVEIILTEMPDRLKFSLTPILNFQS
jgi:hypothetical protein